MALTTNSFTYAGGAQTFTLSLGLGYEAESDITVHVVGELDGMGDQIYRTFTFDSEFVVRVTEDLTVDDVVVVQRTVSQVTRKVNFDTGGDVTPRNIQLQYDHVFSLQQELLDGRVGLLNPAVDAAAASVSAAAAAVSEAAAAALVADAMTATVYDPSTIAADAFDTDNHVDGSTNHVFTAGDDTKLTGIASSANNYSHPNHSGDVTSTGDGATVIVAGKVTFAMMASAAIADAAAFLANTASKILDAAAVWTAAAEVTLTDEATITVDMDLFINAKVTLTDNRTLGNPTNEKVGQTGYIRIIQDAGGTNTLAYGTDWEFIGGIAPTLSAGGDDENLLFYVVLATNRVFASLAAEIS